MENNVGWDLYRSFLAVLQEGSLSGAARALGLTQPTVGRHISALEHTLGQSFFTRSQTGLMPTEAALALRGHAESMHHTAAALDRLARGFGTEVRGSVRVSASEIVGIEILPPIFSALRASHPRLEIELVLSNRLADVVNREADVAIRMASPQQEVLLATRVRNVGIGLYAHEGYLAQHSAPMSPDDLAQHALIGFDTATPYLRDAAKAFPIWTRKNFAFRCDSDLGQLALIRAGAGIGICQNALAQKDPTLKRVLESTVGFALPMWVVMHADLRHHRRCKVAYDALVDGLRAEVGNEAGF